MLINITDNFCWICGKQKPTTGHHGLPQHLKPKQNVIIPICRECHDKIHFEDVNGMYSYIHKIDKQLQETEKNLGILKKMIDENTKLKKIKSGEKVIL